jgi:hypothetical protein
MADNAVAAGPVVAPKPLVLSPMVRYWLFAGAFLLLLALWALVVVGLNFTQSVTTGYVLLGVATFIPLLLDQLHIPVEVPPAILGGLLAWIAPPRSSWLQTISLLALSGLGWVGYVYLQSVLKTERVEQILKTSDVAIGDVKSVVGVLNNFSISIANFCGVVFAAIIGLRLNPGLQVFSPITTAAKGGEGNDPIPKGTPGGSVASAADVATIA